MTTLTTIKQFNELAALRVSETFKTGDKDKIEQYMVMASKATDYIISNYPSMETVINDYDLWKAMCRDVNLNSMDTLSLLFSEDELQQIVDMLDNEEALFSYWKETMAEMEGLEFTMDTELKNNQETLHDIVTTL